MWSEIGVGLVLITIGAVSVHKCKKETTLWKRILSILLVMTGVISIWIVAAQKMPVIRDVKIELIGESENGSVLHFSSSVNRECHIQEIEAFVTVSDGEKTKVPSQFLLIEKTRTREEGFILLTNPGGYVPGTASFVIHHFCPFGFETVSEPKSVKLPPIAPGIY